MSTDTTRHSVVLGEDLRRFFHYMPTKFDPRPATGRQEAKRVFPDKSELSVAYSPSSAWDDVRFSSGRHTVFYENQRCPGVGSDGKPTVSFEFCRLTVEELQGKKKRSFKIHPTSPLEARREIQTGFLRRLNEVFNVASFDKAAQWLLDQGPGIVAKYMP